MGAQFAAVSGTPIAYDAASAEATLRRLIDMPEGCLLVADAGEVIGMTGAMVHAHYFNASHRTGQELFWWIDPEHRGSKIGLEMFLALESWARSQGAQTFVMGALHAQSPEKVGQFYERNGYAPLEHTYMKVLG